MEGTSAFSSLFATGAAPVDVDVDSAQAIAAMPMSVGTTGFAKVVQLTQRNLVANVLQADAAIGIRPDDVMIGVLPFFHIYGMTVLVNLALRKGATVVTMPRFDLDEFLRLMEEHRVTFACLVPPIVLALAKHPGGRQARPLGAGARDVRRGAAGCRACARRRRRAWTASCCRATA